MKLSLLRICCLAAVTLVTAGTAAARQSSSFISPTVVATWVADTTGARGTLRVLVLWRGTPGWFLRPGGSSSHSSSSMSSSSTSGVIRETLTHGGLTFTFEYDPATHVATVAGKPVVLGDRNVILVDDVDSAGGPRVGGTLRVDSRMPGSAGQIGLLLRASPELLAYLRCDARSSDPVANMTLERLCLQNLGVEK